MAHQDGKKPSPEQACKVELEVAGVRYQCRRWPGPGDHRMYRDDRSGLRLPHPVHVSEEGHQWLADGTVLVSPEGEK